MYSLKDYILLAIWLLLSIIMVKVGESYSDCNLGVLFYLKIAGGIMAVFSTLSAILVYASSKGAHNESVSCSASAFMAATCFGLTIWGSIVIFGALGTWTYDPKESNSEMYCNAIVYVLAFGLLVIQWIIFILLMPIFCSFMCNCLCAAYPYFEYAIYPDSRNITGPE